MAQLPTLDIRLDAGVLLEQLRAVDALVAGTLRGDSLWSRNVDLHAISALEEIGVMAQNARAELNLEQIRCTVDFKITIGGGWRGMAGYVLSPVVCKN